MAIIPPIEANWVRQKGDLTDKKGIPLSAVVTSANTHDIKSVTDVIDNLLSNDILYNFSQKIRQGSIISIYALIESIQL